MIVAVRLCRKAVLAATSYIAAEKFEKTRPVSITSSKRAYDVDGHVCMTLGMKLRQAVGVTTEVIVGDGVLGNVSLGTGSILDSEMVGAWRLVLFSSLPVEGSLVVEPGQAEGHACEIDKKVMQYYSWRTKRWEVYRWTRAG